MTLVRILLIVVLGSLTLAALMGVGTLITSSRPSDEIILSMLSVGLFGLTSLGAGFALERRQWRVLMIIGLALSFLSAAVYLVYIWTDGIHDWFGYDEERVLLPLAIWSITLAMLGLQALTRFDNPLVWVRFATLAMIVAAAATLTIGIIAEIYEDLWWRWTGAAAILAVLGVIANPVLYRIAGSRRPAPETTRPELTLTCPRCLLSQTVRTGPSRCARCRLRFNIEIEEPRCPKCQYLLYNLTTPRCPECGHDLAPGEVVASPST